MKKKYHQFTTEDHKTIQKSNQHVKLQFPTKPPNIPIQFQIDTSNYVIEEPETLTQINDNISISSPINDNGAISSPINDNGAISSPINDNGSISSQINDNASISSQINENGSISSHANLTLSTTSHANLTLSTTSSSQIPGTASTDDTLLLSASQQELSRDDDTIMNDMNFTIMDVEPKNEDTDTKKEEIEDGWSTKGDGLCTL